MAKPAAKPRMLMADDERVIADSLAAILCQRGFDAVAVYSGEAAVADALDCPPSVLLTDINMNEMNGIEAANEILRICPECLVLLITGDAQTNSLLEKARADGHDFDVLTKPVYPDAIFQWLDEKRVRSEASSHP